MRVYNYLKNVSKYSIVLLLIMLFNDFFLHAQSKKPFPFALNNKHEIITISTGVLTLGFALIVQTNKPNLSREYLEQLNNNNIKSLDISATRQWSEGAHSASDILRTTIVLSPALLIMPELINKEYNNAFTLFSMYSEALLINGGISLLAKNIANRGRPYLYNSSLTIDEKLQQKEPFNSFFSGHTSVTFCTAVFISKVFSDTYPDSKWKYVIWSSSLLAASTTAYLRYKAGMHFPTDIIVGAIVGSTIGYLIPLLHKNNSIIAMDSVPTSPVSFRMSLRF